MAKRRSSAQKAHIKNLATTRKGHAASATLPSSASKTGQQIEKQRLEDLVSDQALRMQFLEAALEDAETRSTQFAEELQECSDINTELHSKLNSRDAAIQSLEERLSGTILELRKARKRTVRLTRKRRQAQEKHAFRVRDLVAEGNSLRQELLLQTREHEKVVQELRLTVKKLESNLRHGTKALTTTRLFEDAHRLDMHS
ncbi:unnamed protein product [Cyclocybe aegerita]|uniref:Uncharacterized protein n=1 Tax=Cyclocybe aegerita TaxID=1973307 RepID=A0A8S0W284_CYCAE|nr:unnamed protein product [Cyclocybe aegerita]